MGVFPKSSSRHGWPWLRITHGILGLPKISPEFSDDLQSAIFFSKIRRLRRGRAYAHSSPRGRTTAPRRGPRRSAERRYGPSWNAPPTVWPPCAGASLRVWPGTVWAAGEVWEMYGKGMIMMGYSFFLEDLEGLQNHDCFIWELQLSSLASVSAWIVYP